VPSYLGLKVITSKKQVDVLPEIFHTSIPDDLRNSVLACKNREEVIDVGVEFVLKQSRELIDHGVPCLHFFTMNDLSTFSRILNSLRG